MKKINLMLAIAVLMMGMACKSNRNSQSITVQDNANMYNIEAHYAEKKTNAVFEFIAKTLNDHQLFASRNEREFTTIVLPDHTKFELAYKPGYVEIQFNKNENSAASYLKMKNLYNGIAKVLK